MYMIFLSCCCSLTALSDSVCCSQHHGDHDPPPWFPQYQSLNHCHKPKWRAELLVSGHWTIHSCKVHSAAFSIATAVPLSSSPTSTSTTILKLLLQLLLRSSSSFMIFLRTFQLSSAQQPAASGITFSLTPHDDHTNFDDHNVDDDVMFLGHGKLTVTSCHQLTTCVVASPPFLVQKISAWNYIKSKTVMVCILEAVVTIHHHLRPQMLQAGACNNKYYY